MKKVKSLLLSFLFAVSLLNPVYAKSQSQANQNSNEKTVVKKQLQKKLKSNQDVKKGVLANGMDYYIMQNKEPENRIELRLIVKAGANNEEDDQLGVAHFIEHMSFKSTKHYVTQNMKDYMQSIGMHWGRDLNAETSNETTIYIVTIPADNPEYLQKAIDWYADIAGGNVLFTEEELAAEKKVVIEEWRQSLGYSKRRQDQYWYQTFLKNSRQSVRPILGTETSIRDISRQRVVDFYNKWYRSDNISLAIVGDVNPSSIEKLIKTNFNDIKKPSEKLMSVDNTFTAGPRRAVVFKDKEQSNTFFEISEKINDYQVRQTEEDYKQSLADAIVYALMNIQLQQKTSMQDNPFFQASCYDGTVQNPTVKYRFFDIVPKEGLYKESLMSYFDFIESFKQNKITENDFTYVKNMILTQLAEYKKNINKTTSSEYIQNIISEVLYGVVNVNYTEDSEITERILKELTLDYVNARLSMMFENNGDFILFTSPDSLKNTPSEKEIEEIWNSYEAKIDEYVEDNLDRPFAERPAKKAKIVSAKKNKDVGTTKYVLENGVTVITKKTDFEKDIFYVQADANGGQSLYEDKDFPSAVSAVDYVFLSGFAGYNRTQYQKKLLTTTVNISNFNFSEYSQNLSLSVSNKDAETLFQVIDALFTKPEFNDEGWNLLMVNYKELLNRQGLTSDSKFSEKLNTTIYGKDIRKNNISKEFISLLDRKRAEEIYKERTSNAADYTFTIVGDFNEKTVMDLCCYYLGNLPADKNKKSTSIWREKDFPRKVNKFSYKAGEDKQGVVFIGIGNNLPMAKTTEEKHIRNTLTSVIQYYLQLKLNDFIRIKLGGTYGVGANINLITWPKSNYFMNISFNCEPNRAEELSKAVMDELNSYKNTPVSDEDMSKLIEFFKNDYEQNKKQNWWWMYKVRNIILWENEDAAAVKDFKYYSDLITKENLAEYMNQYFDTENCVIGIKYPEK